MSLVGRHKYNSPKRLAVLEERAKRRKARGKAPWLKDPLVKAKAIANSRKAYFFKVKILNEKQHKAIALLSDFMNCWGPEYIANQCGINLATLWNWRNDPFFLKELDKEITRRRTMFRLEAHRRLFAEIKKSTRRGGIKALLAYLKMTGDFKEQIEITEKSTDDLDESQLDEEIQRLQDELKLSTGK